MVKLKNIIRYFVANYPHKSELSKTRLTKMVYLADWYSSLKYGKQLTNIDWFFDHYGPYVVDVFNAVQDDNILSIKNEYTRYGTPKQVVTLNKSDFNFANRLDSKTKDILDDVIRNTESFYWSEFINYIYSSYPIKSSKRYQELDLERLAIECKNRGLQY